MNKADFARYAASAGGTSICDMQFFLNIILESIEAKMKEGEEVKLADFAIFKLKNYGEKSGRNMQTGELMRIPATRRPVAVFSKTFKKRVQSVS